MSSSELPSPAQKAFSEKFLILFAPEHWSPTQRFLRFVGPPFRASDRLVEAIRATENRRQKFHALAEVANLLRAGLTEDWKQVEMDGYTPALKSKQYSAVAETLFLELYSSLDATRFTLFEVYKNCRGIQNKSTEKLFKRAHDSLYGPEFPEQVRQALSSAFSSWYPELRRIRVEVSHGDIGSCHVGTESPKVIYMHEGLGIQKATLVIDDLEARINEFSGLVFSLVDSIFSFLCSQLEPIEVRVGCGMFRGRFYERTVAYSEELDFDSGTCYSNHWFETEPGYLCPMRRNCAAYSR